MAIDRTFYLVSCVSKKKLKPDLAKNLYVSPWFARVRSFIEQSGRPWFILSAKYNLVTPCQRLRPYNKTLNEMTVAERRSWAKIVEAQMDEMIHNYDRVTVFAGCRYREFLMDYLERRWVVEVPLKGLRIGEHLHWLGRQIAHEQRGAS